jgi:integrase/recombinase XerD
MLIDSKEIHFLNKRDSKVLIENCNNSKHKLIMLLMLDAGLRVSEAISLKICDFDFKKRLLKVQSLKKRGKEHRRVIPLSNRLYDTLANYLYKNKLDTESFLFPNQENSDHISRFAVNKFMSRYREKHNINNLHPHALRHTFATQHIAYGTPLENIKTLLGHKKYDTTLIYAHIPEEILKNNIDTIEKKDLTLFDKIKNFISPKRQHLININTAPKLPVVGRIIEKEKIESFVNRDINTILLGGIGSGKTALLENLCFDKKVLKLDDTDNIKKSLVCLLIYLYDNDKESVAKLLFGDFDKQQIETKLNRESVNNLCDEIKKLVEKKEYILLIDNVDRITPKAIKTLENLKDTFTILTSAREVAINKSSFLWNFERVEIKNLEKKYSLELINKLSYDLDIEDYELFRNHIFEQSDGNPRVIFELVERYRKETVITNDVVKDITHFGSMKEIDCTVLILVFLAGLAIMRYLSREVGNDSYRFIGGAAMVILILSRYFFSHTKRKFI